MPIIAPSPAQADELRIELELLQDAIARLRAELDQAQGDRDTHRALLDDAIELRYDLEEQLAATEAELLRQRTTAEIREKLLAGITGSRRRTRREAIARAVRVERLITQR